MIDMEETKEKAPEGSEKAGAYVPQLCKDTLTKMRQDPAYVSLGPVLGAMARPFDSFRKVFGDEGEADRVLAREIDFASQALLGNGYLLNVGVKNPLSLANALKNVALTGMTLNPLLRQAYLVPMGGGVVLMPSYMGLIDLLVNNGLVRKVEAHCVFEGDEFEIVHGSGERLVHRPSAWGVRTEETMLGAYYYAVLTDGTVIFDHMNKAEIDVIKGRSPSVGRGKASPWTTDYCEMARKTLIRRAFKMMPKGGISEDKVHALEAALAWEAKESENGNCETAAGTKDDFEEDEVEWEDVKEEDRKE